MAQVYAMSRYLGQHPPAHILVAGFLGYKAPIDEGSPDARAAMDLLHDVMALPDPPAPPGRRAIIPGDAA